MRKNKTTLVVSKIKLTLLYSEKAKITYNFGLSEAVEFIFKKTFFEMHALSSTFFFKLKVLLKWRKKLRVGDKN